MPNWIFAAIPLALLYVIGTIIDSVRNHNERQMIHYIIDGDRLQCQRAERYQKCKMNHERRYC